MDETHGFLSLHEPRFWYAAAFVLFFVIFGPRLWRALTALLDKRAAEIRLQLDEAGRLRREAETMLADAKAEREAALAQAKTVVEQARAEAARIAEASRAEAEAALRRRERMAHDRIAAAERAAVAEVRSAAADLAVDAARTVIAGTLAPETETTLIDRAIAGLPAALSPRRAA